VKVIRGGLVDDEAGFREFVAARLPRLARVAYLLTGSHHAAQDLVQSVLIKVAKHWPRAAQLDEPDAYLRRAVYHEHVSSWRRHRRELPVAQTPAHAGPADEAEAAVRRMVLRQALARLTPRQRAVIVLRYFEDLSEQDTAETLGCSVGTVKSQTHHALARLRSLAPELADLVPSPTGVSA
jgi:RNA polymerase sigma-70 factor (sigma-E family)